MTHPVFHTDAAAPVAVRRVLALHDHQRNLALLADAEAEARRTLATLRPEASKTWEEEMEDYATDLLDGGINEDGVAVVRCFGVIAECPAWMGAWCGVVSPSRLAKVLERYRDDSRAAQVWLMIDSPGGETAGVDILAQTLAEYSKPVHAVVGSECCSAAYWLASQCASIAAPRSATVGAIGVYCLITDSTKAMAAQGIATHLVTTGPLKGAGAPGQPWTDEQLANIQRLVSDTFALFRGAVSARRTVSDEVWDGGVYTAATGATLGLVDILL